MKTFLLCLLPLIFVGASCDQLAQLFEEERVNPNLVKQYYDNGKIKAEIEVDDDKKRHGLSRQYYPTGGIKTEILYNHGVKEKATQYYENGQKQMEFLYVNGKKQGKRHKYWDNGQLQSVLEYNNDEPGRGLIEYNKSGKEVTKYPTLEVQHIDRLNSTGEYLVEVFFSSNAARGTYYMGQLEKGFLNDKTVMMKKVNGRGRITYKPLPGTFKMEKLHFVGSFQNTIRESSHRRSQQQSGH